jgi:SAM-dependent methyltransferase
MKETRHLYSNLAWLWPLWGAAAGEYAHYGRFVARLIRAQARRPVRTLLDIGCGGGKNVFNLKKQFRVTGLDLSPVMLAQARRLNPECEFIRADMRTFRLGRAFDAILMDDAISHMNTRADFAAAFRSAFAHLNPGGVLIATPDVTTETFRQNETTCTAAAGPTAKGPVAATFIENHFDPDPADDHYEATLLYLIRRKGRLRVAADHWQLGLFSRATWRGVLTETGCSLRSATYAAGENKYAVFACTKPLDPPAPRINRKARP